MRDSVIGVIAEYNPLHKGHQYHLDQIKKEFGARALVTVISSDFLQRGEPACIDKWSRTAMALSEGVDLVLEMPGMFSCHNAQIFASAGVDILASTGVVGAISFGMETPKLPLQAICRILLQEPPAFKKIFREFLEKGCSFAEAKTRATERFFDKKHVFSLGKPNDVLALEYTKRILQCRYPMEILPVERQGASFHDPFPQKLSSATAVRRLLQSGKTEKALELLPKGSASILAREIEHGRAVTEYAGLWKILQGALLSRNTQDLRSFAQMREGFENRLYQTVLQSSSWESFVEACASKRYPRTRVQRHAMHILLGFDHWTNRAAQRLGPPYIRVLGFSSKGQELLQEMRQKATLPVLSRGAWKDRKSFGYQVMEFEHRVARIWEALVSNPIMGREKKRKVLRP